MLAGLVVAYDEQFCTGRKQLALLVNLLMIGLKRLSRPEYFSWVIINMALASLDTDALREICAVIVPSGNPDKLLQKINEADSDHKYRHVFTESDWYRVGGVVSSDGQRLADNLEEWVDDNYNGDMIDFVARFGGAGHIVTSLRGKTHYLTAGEGAGTLDFIQLEIEEVCEVIDHVLIDHGHIPESLEALIDPLESHDLPAKTVSPARYICKKVTHFRDLADDLTSDFSGDPNFSRLLDEWERSSAGDTVAFKDCWSVNVLPVLKDVGEHKYKIKLLSPYANQIYAFDMSGKGAGGHILSMLQSVDKECGFPMAWYFLLITKKYMSYGLSSSISQELGWKKQEHISLADKDREIFENWVANPYWL